MSLCAMDVSLYFYLIGVYCLKNVKVVDSCQYFLTKWFDTFRSYLYMERSKNLEKNVITVQKSSSS